MIETFIEQIRQATGFSPDPAKIVPGKLVRFATSDRRGDESGWCKLFPDAEGGVYGCWRQGIAETWQARQPTSPEQRAAFQEKVRQARQEAAKIEEQQRAECREWCAKMLATARDATSDNSYLKRKGCNAYSGVKVLRDSLLIPVQDLAGTVHGVQFIQPGGSKQFKTGTVKAGNFFKIGTSRNKTVIICEGYATGATIHQATSHAVVIAFDAGNLLPVAQGIRSKYPAMTIILAADDDHATEGNPGLSKAAEAARAVGGLLARPVFPESRGAKDTDFNDLARLAGLEAVKACLDAATIPEQGPDAETAPEAAPESAVSDAWQEPLYFDVITTPELSLLLFPAWLRDYCQAVVDATQTPAGMTCMMTLSVLAACLQRKFEVAPFGDKYREPLAGWTITALEPGSRKTAVVDALTFPLTAWENEQARKYAPLIRENETRRATLEKRIADLITRAAKTADRDDREALLNEVNDLKAEMPDELKAPLIWTDDTTPERLQGLLVENKERIAIISDEGTIFEVMAGLYSNGRANLGVFLKGHSGSECRAERQGRSARLENPCLTFGLCVQPAVVADLSRGDKKRFRGTGALARFLYCLPVSTIGSRDIERRVVIPDSLRARYQARIDELLTIAPVVNEFGEERPRILTLSTAARDSWLAFSRYIETGMGARGEFSSIQDWISKLPGAAIRIAGLVHLAEHGTDSTEIDNDLMTRALDFSELLISHARAAFSLMGDDEATTDAKDVLTWILEERRESFKQRDCQRAIRRLDVDRLERAAKVLIDRHILGEPEKLPGGRGKGKPTVSYQINPAIFDLET